MKNLIVLILFAIAAVAGEPKKGELGPEKEAFLNARYEDLKKSCAQKDARACKRVILFYQKQPKKQNEKDIREAMQILLGACKEGKFDACEMDAWRCFRFGTMAMPYGAEEAIKALVRSCHETDMPAGCIALKYHEKELLDISGEDEVKRLYARLCEPR